VHYLNILILLYESPKLPDAWVIMVYHKHILNPLPHRSGRVVCQCHLPPSAAAAANYKQCVRIPNCHLCTYWYCFSWPPIPLLCMPHITKVNVPQHYNYQNTIQPPHALRLAFAFLKYIYILRKITVIILLFGHQLWTCTIRYLTVYAATPCSCRCTL
jgi:hypothetical protein